MIAAAVRVLCRPILLYRIPPTPPETESSEFLWSGGAGAEVGNFGESRRVYPARAPGRINVNASVISPVWCLPLSLSLLWTPGFSRTIATPCVGRTQRDDDIRVG